MSKDLKTLVVPDIHERLKRLHELQPYIDTADRVVFLGDWFDTFGNSHAAEIAQWLRRHVHNDNYEFLIGNHDAHYFFHNQGFICSGFNQVKKEIISEILGPEDIARFKVFTRAGAYLLSHAGFTDDTIHLATEEKQQEALELARTGGFHPMWNAGFGRGGRAAIGGPIWLDWSQEFRPVKGVRQIVGHSYAKEVRNVQNSLCIDTGLDHVAWVDGHGVQVVALDDLLAFVD